MRRLAALCALLTFPVACRFDRSGIEPSTILDRGSDTSLPDVGLPDRSAPDSPPPDQPPLPDVVPTLDTGGGQPLTASEVGLALEKAQVPCVDKLGQDKGYSIPIVDSSTVSFFPGSVTLPGAPADTLLWVGGNPTVTVLYDLNACDEEYPGQSTWTSAGLLIRKASLDAQNRLVLQTGVGTYDIDLIDVLNNGTFQGSEDFATPDDSKLTDTPQLVNPVTKAKEVIVKLGPGP